LPKLKRLTGKQALAILGKFGFEIYSQEGSHIKVRRFDEHGNKQNITFPKHKTLDTGTCHSIFRQASRYIPEDELKSYFYSE
jgi:predicted RNA binding protein YcfA (HicA-like mRNA interferase family)